MIIAFVSIVAAPSRIATLGTAIADLEGVREVYSMTGDADLLAILRVRDHEQVAEVVTEQICRLEGVEQTRTSIAFREYSRVDRESI